MVGEGFFDDRGHGGVRVSQGLLPDHTQARGVAWIKGRGWNQASNPACY